MVGDCRKTMNDYISREAALKAVNRHYPNPNAMCAALVTIHAAEVRPVVRGQWIPVTNGRGGNECSECHCYALSYQSGDECLSNFCPNCGAKMGDS